MQIASVPVGVVAFVALVGGGAEARADELDDLRAEITRVIGDGRTQEIDDHVDMALRKASMANAPVRLGRIELFAAELDADRPTAKTADRARKAALHLGAEPAGRLAELRWHVSGAQAALAAEKLGAAAMHLQAGRAALARVSGVGGQGGGGQQLAEKLPLGTTDPRRDQSRLDDAERALLARLRRAVEERAGDLSGMPAGHLAALAALGNGEALRPNATGDEPLPPRNRPGSDGLLGKLDRALATAEQREVAAAEQRGDGKLTAAALVRHAETLLRIGRTAEALAMRKRSLAWYRDQGTIDQVVVEARWIADRADKNPRASFAARREAVREIQLALGKLVGPARTAAAARHKGEFVALVEAAAALAAQPAARGGAGVGPTGLELIEPVDLVRDRSAWDQVTLFADGARWKRLGAAGGEVEKMLAAIAREAAGRATDALSLVDNLASPASRARQRASEAMGRGEPAVAGPPSLDPAAITARLSGRTLVVYGRLDAARVAIGVLPAKAGAKILIAALSTEEETALVTALRRGLKDGADGWHEPARALYAQLVAPLSALLGPAAVVIPDGLLVALPFGALENATGKLLAETSALVLSPSLLALSAPRTEVIAPQASLLYGVSRFADPGAPPLPFADREIASLKAVLGAAGRVPRQLPPASAVAQVASEPGRYDVAHIVTRLRLDGEMPMVGALMTATAPLFAFDLSRIAVRANLMVLDAPATARDPSPALMARGLAGIIGSALAWPARSLVVAVQPPEGAAGAALFARLYERYAAGESPSVALAGAQRDMASGKLEQPLLLQAGADPIADASRFVHPRYWAGFTAWGEP